MEGCHCSRTHPYNLDPGIHAGKTVESGFLRSSTRLSHAKIYGTINTLLAEQLRKHKQDDSAQLTARQHCNKLVSRSCGQIPVIYKT